MAGCAETIVKTVVFEGFHFFHFSSNVVSWGMVFDDILGLVGDLGVTFSDLRGSWRQA